MKIAVLITVFNRKNKTIACLNNIANIDNINNYVIDIYIVDGGSSDGTPQAIKTMFPNVNIYIAEGLFWAGGMRKAWSEAILSNKNYDLYWLVNDDTFLYKHALQEGVASHNYSLSEFNKGGVYVESTISPTARRMSYGGRKLKKWGCNKAIKLIPNGKYQMCDLGNANSMFVSRDVFEAIGGLSPLYTHGIADYDYTLRTVHAGFPCFITPTFCGECEDDHGNNWKSSNTNLSNRIKFLYSPKGLAYKEYLQYIKLFFPKEYFFSVVKLWAKTLCPQIWDFFK